VNFLPGWAPNVHPLIVHFPIGLLLTAAGLDTAAWLLRCNRSLRLVATALYVAGTVMLIAAYFTGRAAADTVFLSGMAHAAIKQHWDMAFLTVWFFGALTVIRLLLLRWLGSAPRSAAIGALVFAGFIGVVLIGETGDRGGRLVYEHGVGIAQR
jgi:uncharacterized membrane protein